MYLSFKGFEYWFEGLKILLKLFSNNIRLILSIELIYAETTSYLIRDAYNNQFQTDKKHH